ncbi:MAG: hypothetical protein RL154_427, partial [Pseudomonadota bacterium]
SGDNNDMYITQLASAESNESIRIPKAKIAELKIVMKKDLEVLKKLIGTINSGKESVDKIRAAAQEGNSTHQDIIKRYRALVLKAKSIQAAIVTQKEKLARLEKEVERAQGGVMQAKIFIATELKGKQTIRFSAPDGKDYFYANKGKSAFLSVALIQNEDGSYEVKEAF